MKRFETKLIITSCEQRFELKQNKVLKKLKKLPMQL